MAETAFAPEDFSKIVIIDDETRDDDLLLDPENKFGRGLTFERSTPFGEIPEAQPFPRHLLIPRNEWQARIQEIKETGSSNADLARFFKIPVLNQANTNFCWMNSPVFAAMIIRAQQGQAYIPLSPASAAAQITGYKNVGGWGETAIRWLAKNGVAPQKLWPANAIDRQFKTAASDRAALQFRVTEWFELVPRNLDELISALLRRIPVCIGLNWWRHEVTAMDAAWIDGEIAILIANSWGTNWGTNGYGILRGNKMLPDDAVSPAVMVATQSTASVASAQANRIIQAA